MTFLKLVKSTSVVRTSIRFSRNIWFFPAILTLILLGLTLLRINGSSIGYYQTILFGPGIKDPNLIANQPQPIRSDEWMVNTQMALAQKSNHFQTVNKNIGDGENVSVLVDAPYKDWSIIFKPHNLAFFVMPFDNAFAFRWWVMGYLLILSCYFFILALLPGRKLFASLIATSLFFSPFVQWWYLYGTLGVIYTCLFAGVIFIKMVNEKRRLQSILWAIALAYTATSFALTLYPPFQIPVALAMAAFVIGYLIEKFRRRPAKEFWIKMGYIGGALIVALILTLTFLATRESVIKSITSTAYPGKRVVASGNYDGAHLFVSHLSPQFQNPFRSGQYSIPEKGIGNQSETANFILIIPFLFLPGIFLLAYSYRKKKVIDWPLLTTSVMFVLFLVRLFVPHTDILFKLLFLSSVPHNRLVIGIGILGIIHLLLFVRHLSGLKRFPLRLRWLGLYLLAILAVELALSIYTAHRFPGFIGHTKMILFSLPLPIITYLILTKRFAWAAVGLLAFSMYATIHINPLYRGTKILTQTPLSFAIRDFASKDRGKWASENMHIENFEALNGVPSLSGVYAYPQLGLWKSIDNGKNSDDYNRYAHVTFDFDRDPAKVNPTSILLLGADNFRVETEPCSDFLKQQGVSWIVTKEPLVPETTGANSCAHLAQEVDYPNRVFYIYHIR